MSSFKVIVLGEDIRINNEWYESPGHLYDAIDTLLADRDATTLRSRATVGFWSLEAEWPSELIAIKYEGRHICTITSVVLDSLCEKLEETLDVEGDSLHGGYSETDG